MRQSAIGLSAIVLACLLVAGALWAQRPGQSGRSRPSANPPGGESASQGPQLPDDPNLVKLHREFVVKATDLAEEYERKQDIERARVCYEQILKLVPGYPNAQDALARIRQKEATAQRKVLDVLANKPWQDTGVELIAGKPLMIRAAGNWNFRMSHELGPDGMTIPEELRDFNLGSLIGLVGEPGTEDAKPFFVGSGIEFASDKSGRLLLRMYDSDPADNSGKVSVEIRGTFDRK